MPVAPVAAPAPAPAPAPLKVSSIGDAELKLYGATSEKFPVERILALEKDLGLTALGSLRERMSVIKAAIDAALNS